MIESDLLGATKDQGIRHGFFTREGGVSGGIYASLNCGLGSGDAPDLVRENRARVAARLGASPGDLVTVRQVHSPRALVAEAPWPTQAPPEADAIVTRTPGLVVGALSADCAPVLFADPEARIVAAAHAGWRGALGGVIESTLAVMEELGARRERIRAVVGPAISQSAYEVEVDFSRRFIDDDGDNTVFFSPGEDEGHLHFDLAGYCANRLEKAGVVHRQVVHLCTYSNESHFFSYRRSVHRNERDYGRQISAIVIL